MDESPPHTNFDEGHLEMYIGPMYGGKSSKMMEGVTRLHDVFGDKKKVLVINSLNDNRNDGELSCHSSLNKKISEDITYVRTKNLTDIVDIEIYDIIGIDEGNMYPDIVQTTKDWVNSGKYVVIAALTGNFKMEMFDNIHMQDISPLIHFADYFEHCRALCKICSNKFFFKEPNASFSKRLIEDQAELCVGNDIYIPTCRKCHSS